MRFLRALPLALLAGGLLALAGCSTPPPPRVTTRAPIRINTALLLVSEDGKLSTDQLAAKRDEVVRYLTERGLLAPEDVLVPDTAAADRIIRVAISESGGFKVTIFNPGGTGAYYSAPPDYDRVRGGDYWPVYDPWFDQGYYYSPYPAPGYYRYLPRNEPRPHYPPGYTPPPSTPPASPPPATHKPARPHDRDHDARPPTPRPSNPDRNHDGRPDWHNRPPANRPDNHDRGHDTTPRPSAPPPITPSPPSHSEPRPAPEPRPQREPRDQDRRDYPEPAK
ncbi:hypothetical protein [Oleiharenicola sp. Vm1]|uniref:hypothetical protein n=1 Tax=Oleiharenicola sp. Vm1 TaxID=3398393 RepID=UPI0039F46140